MPLKALLSYLMHQHRVIERLAESPPMRNAARIVASMFFKGKHYGEETIEKLKDSEAASEIKKKSITAQTFGRRFSEELKEGFKNFNEELKKK